MFRVFRFSFVFLFFCWFGFEARGSEGEAECVQESHTANAPELPRKSHRGG